MSEPAARPTAEPIAGVIAARVRALREERGLNQQQLADRVAARGLPWKRATVVNLEKRAPGSRGAGAGRDSVSVQELLALALVLDVPPVALLVDPGAASTPLAADVEPSPWDALLWATGQKPLGDADGRAWRGDAVDLVVVAAAAHDCLQHLEAIEDPAWTVTRDSASGPSRMVRSAELQALQDQERVAWLERLAYYLRDLRALGMTPAVPAYVQKRADEAGIDLTSGTG